jgi:hypothetical protein
MTTPTPAGKKPGDHGLIKTQHGYHIVYFLEFEDQWRYVSRQGLHPRN